jgi:hypothetical protein
MVVGLIFTGLTFTHWLWGWPIGSPAPASTNPQAGDGVLGQVPWQHLLEGLPLLAVGVLYYLGRRHGKTPSGVTNAEVTIFNLRKQVHEKDETINAVRENTSVIAWDKVFKVQRMKADPIATDPKITYQNKLRMNLTNISGELIYVWLPLWESSIVPSQNDPPGARMLLERSLGSWARQEWDQWKDKWVEPPVMRNIEYCCAKVQPGFSFECYLGLKPHATDSIAGLLARHSTIGTAAFPVKINGRIYEIRVPASEV